MVVALVCVTQPHFQSNYVIGLKFYFCSSLVCEYFVNSIGSWLAENVSYLSFVIGSVIALSLVLESLLKAALRLLMRNTILIIICPFKGAMPCCWK